MHSRAFIYVMVGMAMVGTVGAQTIELRDGSSIKALGLRRDGDTVAASIQTAGGQQGEVGYPVGTIARIDFPEPALIKTASDLIAKGPSDDTLRQLAQAVTYYQPFLDVPGNWWKPLIRYQIDALTAAHRDRELDAITVDLGKRAGADPDLVRILRIRQAAAFLRQNNAQKVLELLEPVVRDENATAGDLAEGWLYLGAAHLARREYKQSLLAYLHIPVYTPERTGLMPAALLGSARAYIGLDDKIHAKDALNSVVTSYSSTPEAAEAKQQLEKLAARAVKAAGS